MRALILVDVQRDFLPGGALEVPDGDAVVPVANRLAPRFPLVVATQDWHPAGHVSFASSHPGREPFDRIELDGLDQTLWPDHCVQGSPGAGFADDLDMRPVEAIVRKGTDPGIDSYSGFFDNGHRKKTGLAEYLRGREVDAVYLVGLAADVCVAFTARDACALGFRTTVVRDGTRGIGDVDAAFDALGRAGAHFADAEEVLAEVESLRGAAASAAGPPAPPGRR